jgi:CubicO group peptidase (beta-lactamase class C family)
MEVLMNRIGLFFIILMFLFPSHSAFATGVIDINFDEIDQFVEEQRKENGLAGVSYVIVSSTEVLHSNAFGTAESNKGMTTSTPVVIGSTSKAFTALSVMQLVQDGKIQLTESLATYLPTFKNTAKEQITIADLLHHTSGLPTMAGLVLVAQSQGITLQETIQSVMAVSLTHPVGTEFEYSNINYILLAAIVEQVSKTPYNEYVTKNILVPFNMKQTFVNDRDAKELSPGHAPWFGFTLPTKVPYYSNAIASGYMISSAEDMAKFLMAHMDQSNLIPSDIIKQLQTGVSPISFMEKGKYGMGWFERELYGQKVIGHGGDIPSTGSSDFYYLPEKELGVVVVSNTHNGQFVPGNVHGITEGIIAKLTYQTPELEEGMSFSTYYKIFNTITAAILIATLTSFYSLFKQRKLKSNIITTISIMLQLLMPSAFFLSVPLFLKAPWEAAFILQPDLITVLFIFFSLIVLRGIWLLANTIRFQKARRTIEQ